MNRMGQPGHRFAGSCHRNLDARVIRRDIKPDLPIETLCLVQSGALPQNVMERTDGLSVAGSHVSSQRGTLTRTKCRFGLGCSTRLVSTYCRSCGWVSTQARCRWLMWQAQFQVKASSDP